MNKFRKLCQKELAYVESLDAIQEHIDFDADVPGIVCEEVRDRAARLGLADLVAAMPKRPTLASARVYLARCLGERQKSDLLTVKQAAERLGVSSRTIYDLVERGRLRCQRIGLGRGTIRFRPADLEGNLAKPAPQAYHHLTL